MQVTSLDNSLSKPHWDKSDPKDIVNLYRGIQLQLITALLSLGLAVIAFGIPNFLTDAMRPNVGFGWLYTSLYVVVTILLAIDIWVSCVQAVIYFRWEVTVRHTGLFFLLGFTFDVVCTGALGKNLAFWTGAVAVMLLIGVFIYWYDIANNVYPTVRDTKGLIKNQWIQLIKLFCFFVIFVVFTVLQVLLNVSWMDLLVGLVGLILVIVDLMDFSVFKRLLEE